MKHTFKTQVTLKSGRIIPVGTVAMIEFKTISINGHDRDFMEVTLADGLVYKTTNYTRFFKAPSIKTLEKWSMDSIAKSVTGGTCEPDGHSSDNAPSWLLALGMI
jgi:hypothetical protein